MNKFGILSLSFDNIILNFRVETGSSDSHVNNHSVSLAITMKAASVFFGLTKGGIRGKNTTQ